MNVARLARLWTIQAVAFSALLAAEGERAPGGTIAMARIDRRRRRARARCRRSELAIARTLARA